MRRKDFWLAGRLSIVPLTMLLAIDPAQAQLAQQKPARATGGSPSVAKPRNVAGTPSTADAAAVNALLKRLYALYDQKQEVDYSLLTTRFSAAFKECYRVEALYGKKTGDENELGACLDDAGSFIPGQDSTTGVPSKSMRVTLKTLGPDKVLALVHLKVMSMRDSYLKPVKVYLVRQTGGWKVADLDNTIGISKPESFLGQLVAAIDQLRKELRLPRWTPPK